MATTSQQFVPIDDIHDDLVFLKDGGVCSVITTSAVNFGLLFETEQVALIDSFAGLLNSLSFPIQIVINSYRLDVSSYLNTIDQALARQPNPQLKNMGLNYRQFVKSLIKEKNVLDKQFYVCTSVSPIELGLIAKKGVDRTKKALTVLSPRKDHLIRQLNRLGLKARQLNNQELAKLFFNLYNQDVLEASDRITPQTPIKPAVPRIIKQQLLPTANKPGQIQPTNLQNTIPSLTQIRLQPGAPRPFKPFPANIPTSPTPQPVPVKSATQTASPTAYTSKLAGPYVVEELPDDN